MSSSERISETVVDIELSPEGSLEETNILENEYASAAVTNPINVLLLDPKVIRISTDPNRSPASYKDQEFEELCISIEAAGTNIVPIHVTRRTDKSKGTEDISHYDLVSGSRRLRAAIECNLLVRAIVTDIPISGSIGLDRLLENVCRKDLSPLEFGQQIVHILETEDALSLGRLALKIGRDKSLLSRAVELARLPVEIIQGFADPSELRYADAKPLKEAWDKNQEAVLAEIKTIRDSAQLKHSEIVQRIKDAAYERPEDRGVAPCNTPIQMTVGGLGIGQLSVDKKGMTNIAMSLKLMPKENDMLRNHIEAFVKRHVMKKPQPKRSAKKTSERKNAESTGSRSEAEIEIESASQGETK